MTGQPICRAWITNPDPYHGSWYGPAQRFVCTLPAGHHDDRDGHLNQATGWGWDRFGWMARDLRRIWREWTCNGILNLDDPHTHDPAAGQVSNDAMRWSPDVGNQPIRCGVTVPLTVDEARAAGWRIHHDPKSGWDAMCPRCGAPDQVTVRYVQEIERTLTT